MLTIDANKYGGKWIAIKGEKVVDASINFKTLSQRIDKRRDKNKVGYCKVPKGYFAG